MPDSPATPLSDVGNDISAAWDELQDGSSPAADTGESSASAPAGESQPSSSPEGASADAARARDAAGRFTKAEKEAAEAAAAAEATPEFRIPDKWPPQVKERLQAIHAANPEHAQFVLEQYEHFRREAAQHANRATQQLKAFDDLLAPGRQQRALNRVDDATYVRQLIAAGDFLDKKPVDGIKHLMQNYGITLEQLMGQQGGEQAPEIPTWAREMREQQERLTRALQEQYVGAQQQQLREAGDWIQSFASQRDASGTPLYPHFDAVLGDIVFAVQHQIDRGEQVDVKAAYDKAVRLNDSIWLKEQAARSGASKKEAEARRLREIEDAKRAGISVSGSGGASSDVPADSVRGELERLYDKYVS